MSNISDLDIEQKSFDPVENAPSADHDEFFDAPPTIGNSADVAYQLRQIKQLTEDMRQFEEQATEAADFYARRIEALKKRADFLKENVGRWLKMNGLQKLATPNGTVHFASRKEVTLPEDEQLLAWVKSTVPAEFQKDILKTVTKESVDKKQVKQYIKSSGVEPEGYVEKDIEEVKIRKAA